MWLVTPTLEDPDGLAHGKCPEKNAFFFLSSSTPPTTVYPYLTLSAHSMVAESDDFQGLGVGRKPLM